MPPNDPNLTNDLVHDLEAPRPLTFNDPRDLIPRIRRRPEQPIGVVLLNQRLLGGVSNVAKSEVLFQLRVSPFRKIGTLRDSMLGQILRHGQARLATPLPPPEALWVYGRSGEPCRVCSTEVRMRRQGLEARSTYFCPRCQDVG